MRKAVAMAALMMTLQVVPGVIGEQPLYAQGPDPRVADLVRSGTLRVGVGLVPTFATKDPATGELRGVAAELARALAARLGVQFQPVEYPSPAVILEGLKVNAWDVAFLGIDQARRAEADFSSPYLQVDSTYVVPAGSSVRNIADADQPGVRIAVTRNSAEDFALSRTLRRAELIRVDTTSAGFDVLRAGNADLLAVPRPTALLFSAQLPDSRVLEDRFHVVFHAIAVAKGYTGRLAYMTEFIEEAKASGLVQRAVERAHLRGVQVAPAGNPDTQ